MSNKEVCIEIINNLEEEQLGNVAQLLKNVKKMFEDEAFDEAFCLQLLKDYEDDLDTSKSETMSLKDFSRELGIDLK